MIKRVFLIVLDSVGAGALPDAADYGDAGSDTIGALVRSGRLNIPVLEAMGFLNIPRGKNAAQKTAAATGAFGRAAERSKGKDTTTGHWEIAGVSLDKPFPTYPDGFPESLLCELERKTGIGWLCNKPYSGTQVIDDYADAQRETGKMIVYTSADSVFQAAAHTDVIPLKTLYEYCQTARELCDCGRIIARPFEGERGCLCRTRDRHDFSLTPPRDTVLDQLKNAGLQTLGVGKIGDIFAQKGITCSTPTRGNDDGMATTISIAQRDFSGLCFVNLVDFDMLFGHRNNVDGYADALSRFDGQLAMLMPFLKADDLLIITADHGCDPSTPSTDHSREYIPILAGGARVRANADIGTRSTFADIAETIADCFGTAGGFGTSFLPDILA